MDSSRAPWIHGGRWTMIMIMIMVMIDGRIDGWGWGWDL